MSIKSHSEFDKLQVIGKIVRKALDEMAEAVRPGVSTAEVDEIGGLVLAFHGAESAPPEVYGVPAAVCISIEPKTVSHSGSQGVVPAGERVEMGDAKSSETVFGHLQAFWIVTPVEISFDTKAGFGCRSADVVKHRLVGA